MNPTQDALDDGFETFGYHQGFAAGERPWDTLNATLRQVRRTWEVYRPVKGDRLLDWRAFARGFRRAWREAQAQKRNPDDPAERYNIAHYPNGRPFRVYDVNGLYTLPAAEHYLSRWAVAHGRLTRWARAHGAPNSPSDWPPEVATALDRIAEGTGPVPSGKRLFDALLGGGSLMPPTIEQVQCQRCGWRWFPRSERRPTRCANPKCSSPYWDRPRTRKAKA